MGMIIDRNAMENAVEYLAESDEEYARAETLFHGLSAQRKVVKAQCFMRSGAGSAAASEQDAYQTMAYQQHLEKIELSELSFLTLKAKRITAAQVIDCWRSLNAARNKGQIQ